jgi:hypothetical protein
VSNFTPRPLYPREINPVSIEEEDELTPEVKAKLKVKFTL